MKHEADRFHGIVGNGKGVDADILDREIRSRLELPDIGMGREFVSAQHFRGQPGAIDGNRVLLAENAQPGDVVAMFMGEENAVEGAGLDAC